MDNDKNFVNSLLLWYNRGKRDLPWRRTKDPYRIWISEIMLQQTRVGTVIPYYNRFIRALPDIHALAVCPEDELLKLWEGLGYYSRARNLKKAAQKMEEEWGGCFPDRYEEIRRLPGIGDYTAGAVGSIAFGINIPAVDGNVLRVFARFHGTDENVLAQSFRRKAASALRGVMEKEKSQRGMWDPGSFNQALIELGALVCMPNGSPVCRDCPLRTGCRAFREGTWNLIPVRLKKKERRIEKRTVLLIRKDGKVLIDRRPDRGLLAGMYEFPNLEGRIRRQEVPGLVRELGFVPSRILPLADEKHIFSHITWEMTGYDIEVSSGSPDTEKLQKAVFAGRGDLKQRYALPSAFAAYEKYLMNIRSAGTEEG